MFKYREVIDIGLNCFLIIGRHLNVQKCEADVANAIIYKSDNKLYMIDTGALIDFRQTLLKCCKELSPYEEVILINTHGHGDHVGNNNLIDELEASRKTHLLSAHDLSMMRDNRKFFEYDFKKIEPFLGEGKTAKGHLDKLLALFAPLKVNSNHLTTLETLPLQDIKIGNIHWSGWNFEDRVYVLRTQGHSAGHVIIYLPKFKHMHMGDETNGYCNLFHDCDHLKSLESHTKVLSMLDEGSVASMSDGHTFELDNHDMAKQRLENLIHAHYLFGNEIRQLLSAKPEGLLFEEIVDSMTNSKLIGQLPTGANPNPTYAKLQLLSKFKDLGILPDSSDLKKARFQFNIYQASVKSV